LKIFEDAAAPFGATPCNASALFLTRHFKKAFSPKGADLIILIAQMVLISGLAIYSLMAFRYGKETR
jgi:hypothetical protein